MPNRTNRGRAARKLQQITDLTYAQALDLLRNVEVLPDLDDPAAVAALLASKPSRPDVPAETAPVDIVWADADGDFVLYGGGSGNPGCDNCGSFDAIARVNGTYVCAADDSLAGAAFPKHLWDVVGRDFGLRRPTARCRFCDKQIEWGFVDYSDTQGWVHSDNDEHLCDPDNPESSPAAPYTAEEEAAGLAPDASPETPMTPDWLWRDPHSDGWVDAWNGWYPTLAMGLRDGAAGVGSPWVLRSGEGLITEAEAEARATLPAAAPPAAPTIVVEDDDSWREEGGTCPTCGDDVEWDPAERFYFCPNEWEHL